MNSQSKPSPQELIKVHKEKFSILSKTPYLVKVVCVISSLFLSALCVFLWVMEPFFIRITCQAISYKFNLFNLLAWGSVFLAFSNFALVHLFHIRKYYPKAKKRCFSIDQYILGKEIQKEFNLYLDKEKDKFNVNEAIEEVDKIGKERLYVFIVFGSIFLVLFSSIFGVYYNHALNISNIKSGEGLNISFLIITFCTFIIALLAYSLRDFSYIISSFKRIQNLKSLLQHYKNEYNL